MGSMNSVQMPEKYITFGKRETPILVFILLNQAPYIFHERVVV